MNPSNRPHLTVSVVIVTYERPEYLARCLRQLREQTRTPDEVIVVDASISDESQEISARLGDVTYIENAAGRGNMTNSRNVGWRASSGHIVAFIDDDAFAARDWLEHLVAAYADESIGGVGGRVLRSEFDVSPRTGRVGALTPQGDLIGNFDVLTGVGLEVFHLIGCNMSFRRVVLDGVGGFDETYPGTEVREETDLCFRIIEAGYGLWYEPKALVVHVGGPYIRGQRFDLRYDYFTARNHMQFLVRHFGVDAPVVRRYAADFSRRAGTASLRRAGSSLASFGVSIAGLVVGVRAGMDAAHGTPSPGSRSERSRVAFASWIGEAGRSRSHWFRT